MKGILLSVMMLLVCAASVQAHKPSKAPGSPAIVNMPVPINVADNIMPDPKR
ncbi:MAG: hypothetical protein M1549_03435 [Candidatus Dependentiae bacterium]|nr:hypothetical protein [Candidatus Dependentiae bacterium]